MFIVLLMPIVAALLVLNLADYWSLSPVIAGRSILAWLGLPPASWEGIRILLFLAFFGLALHRYFRFIEKSFVRPRPPAGVSPLSQAVETDKDT
ncbi:hypothetical protein [Azospirillum sp. B4]|uniref:hypothetical protein n=1 Tax=Azospirillum sp. B4 TaxID=95605 RepID=UPI0003465AD4|nr:hypothetical protein [Azospirillum sp. B4]